MNSDLTTYLTVIEPAFVVTYGAAIALLGALGVTTMVFASVRGALIGENITQWVVRMILVVLVISAYRPMFAMLIEASQEATNFFAQIARWENIADRLQSIAPGTNEDSSLIEKFGGYMTGQFLPLITSISYFLIIISFELISTLSGVFAAILKILGPFMVVGGIVGSGRSLSNWFTSLIQVLLWPTIPPLLLFLIMSVTANAAETDNVAFLLSQNIILTVLVLTTPAIVSFMLGQTGIGSLSSSFVNAANAGLRNAASRGGSFLYQQMHKTPMINKNHMISERPDDHTAPNHASQTHA